MHVLRWGQSAYESDADLALEAAAAHALGWGWTSFPDVAQVPDLSTTEVLVVTSKVRVTPELLDGTPVRYVLTTTSGYDHIDVPGVTGLGVQVGRCPQARRDCVVEHALGAMLSLSKRWPAQIDRARGGVWCRKELPALAPLGLRGSTVAVVGLGVIGSTMARVLDLLGAHVLGVDPAGVPDGVEEVGLPDALRRCDVLTLHCSLTATSRHLIGPQQLDQLDDAVVVNTARGDSLDVEAAVDRIHSGRLRGLAVDVFPTEPYPGLATGAAHPNVLFTPHGAGFAPDLGSRVAQEVAATLGAIDAGRALPAPVVAL